MGKAAEYEATRYRHLDQALLNWLERRLVSKLAASILPPKSLVLDMPCGYGRLASEMLRSGMQPVCADISLEMATRCRKRLGGSAPVVVADAVRLPFRDAAFDAVLCVRLIQHGFRAERLHELTSELSRISRLAVVASFYEKKALHVLWRKLSRRRTGITMLSAGEFRSAAEKAGLAVARRLAVLPLLHSHVIMVMSKVASRPRLDAVCKE